MRPVTSLHRLVRESDGWPQTLCGREGRILTLTNGRRFMLTEFGHKYLLATAGQSATCRHCLRWPNRIAIAGPSTGDRVLQRE